MTNQKNSVIRVLGNISNDDVGYMLVSFVGMIFCIIILFKISGVVACNLSLVFLCPTIVLVTRLGYLYYMSLMDILGSQVNRLTFTNYFYTFITITATLFIVQYGLLMSTDAPRLWPSVILSCIYSTYAVIKISTDVVIKLKSKSPND